MYTTCRQAFLKIVNPPQSPQNVHEGDGENEELLAIMEDRTVFVDFLKEMLHLDEQTRMTPVQALQHPFMTMSHLLCSDGRRYVNEGRCGSGYVNNDSSGRCYVNEGGSINNNVTVISTNSSAGFAYVNGGVLENPVDLSNTNL
ncbi:hypothetical protein HELRODRAFT_159920 [Helobdella robusta]|uniref:Protein kinase domain-containing protein n=1 Tax=Helobdella robusta TaxID=6412 RepID=T1EPK0_HELRO|nr:hypothetical protein HELRODRAFT_159920 [Helobdella robusta]ESO05843.1 hypothetical protein HELRODRAFT_159920 [Helobdella robusta]